MSRAVETANTGPDEAPRPDRRLRRLRLLAFVVVPAAFVGFVAFGLFRTAGPRHLEGRPAPEFSLPRLGGGSISSEDLEDSPVVVNFWASWCLPCREEAAVLESAWQKYRGDGVRFLGVSVQDAEEDALRFVKTFGITFPSVRDTNLELWGKFGVRGLPETFFIDHRWRFAAVGSGTLVGNRGTIKVLGAIDPAVLDNQIRLLLERRREDR